MLQLERRKYYKVKSGQTAEEIARAFHVSVWSLIKENALKGEVCEGQILKICERYGNAYFAQAGQSKRLLCGSEENYRKNNGTDILYIGMRVIL